MFLFALILYSYYIFVFVSVFKTCISFAFAFAFVEDARVEENDDVYILERNGCRVSLSLSLSWSVGLST